MILAFGDSHRSKTALETIAQIIFREQPQGIVHTGDNYHDFLMLKKRTKVQGFGVRGNCDVGISGAPEELILEYAGKRILLTHGHIYGVKTSLRPLLDRAGELAVNAVIFGHSHIQLARQVEEIWLINPGSIPLPRGGSQPGYARVSFDSGIIRVELVQV